jgi:hypothetical protein
MNSRKMRTEDDLRAAFALAAQDAPNPLEALAKLADAERTDRVRGSRRTNWRGRWVPLAAVAAVVLAIAVPVALIAHSSSNDRKASSASAAQGGAEHDAAIAPSAAAGAAAAGSTGPAATSTAGPTSVATPGPVLPPPPVSGGPLCTPADVSLSLTWRSVGSALAGILTATNHTGAACDLAVKPAIYPLDTGGQRLDVLDAATDEGYAGPTQLAAGARTSSTLSWNGWCGAKAGSTAQVEWGAGTATATVAGPTTPGCVRNGATNITSTWFSPLS